MVEKVEQKTGSFTKRDKQNIADYILTEFMSRQTKRKFLEAHWTEIDRQVAMIPKEREIRSGEKKDWYPDEELPLQFNALEVIAADARRLKFPRGTEWFSVSAEISDEYINRWQGNRETRELIPGSGFTDQPDSIAKSLAQQVDLDQETANLLSKTVIDHYHRQYDFRTQIDLFDAEQIKYGTGVVRVRPVKTPKTFMDFRGQKSDGTIGPAVIPCSIKNTYLDVSSHAVLHEGIMIAPLTLRVAMQRLDNVIMAAKRGGKDRGWLPNEIKNLKPMDQKTRSVKVIEGEGDFVIPRSSGSIFLPNFLITIAVGQGDVRVIRMRENPVPFRSYVPGHYMRHDPSSPYGTSPLMAGRPIQEAATEVFNDMLAASRLNADPPIVYDRFDQNHAASGGPEIFPGAVVAADSPNSIEDLSIGDVGALTNSYLALIKQHEDVTGANDARRGAPIRSHTTTGGIELEASRGISRTDDFVATSEMGPIRTILYMEWDIIKSVMKSVQPISVGAGGIEGWVNVSASDLPDNLVFHVHGASGALNEREMASNFLAASNFVVGLAGQAAQLQQPLDVNFNEIAVEAYKRAGVNNAGRFIGSGQGPAGQPPAEPGLSEVNQGATDEFVDSLGAAQAVG